MGRPPKPDGSEAMDTRGYWRIKVNGKWKLKHRHIAETEILHRELRPHERVWFRDGNNSNCAKDNIVVKAAGEYASRQPYRLRASIAVLERKDDELHEIIAGLRQQLRELEHANE